MAIILSFRRIWLPSCTPPMATRQNASTMGFISGIQLNGAWLKKPAAEATPRGWHFKEGIRSQGQGQGEALLTAGLETVRAVSQRLRSFAPQLKLKMSSSWY